VHSEDQRTRERLIGLALPENSVVWNFKGHKIRAHLLTEGTLTVVNTGNATDTILTVKNDSLFTVSRNALFNATLQNESKEAQSLIGLLFSVDHTVTSPDTDKGPIAFDIIIGHKSGATKTYSNKAITDVRYMLDSFVVVEGAAILDLPYFGPLIYSFHEPIEIKRNEDTIEYFSGVCMLWRRTSTDRYAFTAHTAVTTYTIKVNGYAIVADVELVQMFDTLDDLWAQFIMGG
jgi:hypothetical protein